MRRLSEAGALNGPLEAMVFSQLPEAAQVYLRANRGVDIQADAFIGRVLSYRYDVSQQQMESVRGELATLLQTYGDPPSFAESLLRDRAVDRALNASITRVREGADTFNAADFQRTLAEEAQFLREEQTLAAAIESGSTGVNAAAQAARAQQLRERRERAQAEIEAQAQAVPDSPSGGGFDIMGMVSGLFSGEGGGLEGLAGGILNFFRSGGLSQMLGNLDFSGASGGLSDMVGDILNQLSGFVMGLFSGNITGTSNSGEFPMLGAVARLNGGNPFPSVAAVQEGAEDVRITIPSGWEGPVDRAIRNSGQAQEDNGLTYTHHRRGDGADIIRVGNEADSDLGEFVVNRGTGELRWHPDIPRDSTVSDVARVDVELTEAQRRMLRGERVDPAASQQTQSDQEAQRRAEEEARQQQFDPSQGAPLPMGGG